MSPARYNDGVAKRYGQTCPVAKSLEVVGERWTLLIVRDLLRGPARFQDLRAQLSGVPPRLLSSRLKDMQTAGLVSRELYSEHPPRASYTLTERGRELGLVVGALATWGRPFVARRGGPVHTTCGRRLELVHYCPHCDDRVDPSTVRVPVAAGRAASPAIGRRRTMPARRLQASRT